MSKYQDNYGGVCDCTNRATRRYRGEWECERCRRCRLMLAKESELREKQQEARRFTGTNLAYAELEGLTKYYEWGFAHTIFGRQ